MDSVAGKTILLVDDESDIVKTTSLALAQEGFKVVTAGSAEAAQEIIRLKQPDLIVLDLMLPKMSGSELALVLKGHGQSQNIPIILITALVNKDEEELISRKVIDYCLKKPFELVQLSAKIKELLEQKG